MTKVTQEFIHAIQQDVWTTQRTAIERLESVVEALEELEKQGETLDALYKAFAGIESVIVLSVQQAVVDILLDVEKKPDGLYEVVDRLERKLVGNALGGGRTPESEDVFRMLYISNQIQKALADAAHQFGEMAAMAAEYEEAADAASAAADRAFSDDVKRSAD